MRLTSTSVKATRVTVAVPASTNQTATPVTALPAGSAVAVRSVSLRQPSDLQTLTDIARGERKCFYL